MNHLISHVENVDRSHEGSLGDEDLLFSDLLMQDRQNIKDNVDRRQTFQIKSSKIMIEDVERNQEYAK